MRSASVMTTTWRGQGEELRQQFHAASARGDQERRHVVKPGAGVGAVGIVIEDEICQRDEALGAGELEEVGYDERGRPFDGFFVRAIDGFVRRAAVVQVLEKLSQASGFHGEVGASVAHGFVEDKTGADEVLECVHGHSDQW
jgi:hypothetical protein